MRTITAISVNTTPKRWVMNTSQRPGNMLAAETTEHKDKAMDFGNISYALSVISRLHNPHDRVFDVESIQVLQPKRINGDLI